MPPSKLRATSNGLDKVLISFTVPSEPAILDKLTLSWFNSSAKLAVELYDANGIPVIVRIAFVIGAILSISTIVWSVWRVPELPLSDDERAAMADKPLTVQATFAEIADALIDAGFEIRVDSAVEKESDVPADARITLDKASLGKPAPGRGYVKSITFDM